MGVANVLAALDAGVRTIDSSVGGLGGCPYSPGCALSACRGCSVSDAACVPRATGNVATEDVLYAISGSTRYATLGGAEERLDDVAAIGWWISKTLGRETTSRVGKAIQARKEREEREDRKAKL